MEEGDLNGEKNAFWCLVSADTHQRDISEPELSYFCLSKDVESVLSA